MAGGRAIRRWLKRHLGDKTFFETQIPLKIVAYDLFLRQELVIDSGSILDAVERSIAIPGVIRPVRDKQRVIIDGGVLNPLPTNVLSVIGVNRIIAVNVLQSPEDVTKGFLLEQEDLKARYQVSFFKAPWAYILFRIGRIFKRMFNPNIANIIVSTLQAAGYVLAEQSGQQADVMIHPNLVGLEWFELYRVEDLIKRGEDAARQAIPKIRQALGEG